VSVIYLLLPVALLLATAAVIAFVRAVRAGQFDDLETPRWRVLTDDETPADPAGSRSCDDPRPASRHREER